MPIASIVSPASYGKKLKNLTSQWYEKFNSNKSCPKYDFQGEIVTEITKTKAVRSGRIYLL